MSRATRHLQQGFILLPVLTLLALIALFAYMLNRSGGMEGRVTASRATAIQARYLAEAAMRHAQWFLTADCSYRAALSDIPFGAGHTYGAVLTDNSDGTIHLVATGVVNGQNPDPSTHFTEIVVDDYRCVPLVPKAIYWSDWGEQRIRRAELDGSGITDLLSATNGLLLPKPLALDQENRTIYWGDGNLISRAEVDGGSTQQVVDCLNCTVSGIDLDPANSLFYYTDSINNQVVRATLNGNNPTVLIDTLIAQPSSIRVDLVNGRLYFADGGNQEIKSARLDGTDLTTVIPAVAAQALALDPAAKRIYYFDRNTREIDRIDFNGGGLATIIALPGGSDINGLDLDPANSLLYWSRLDTRSIQRARLDGSGLTDLVVSGGVSKPWGLRLGPAQPIVLPRTKGPYWTEDQGNKKQVVRRAEVDGSNIQTLVSAQKTTQAIKFDLPSEYLYWAGDQRIMRATVKGAQLTVVHDCATGTCASVFGLALDSTNQQVYWVDQAGKKIMRVNYSGGNETTLVTGLNKPWDIDLDLVHGKMYWVDEGTKTLSRANLDGSGVEVVLAYALGAPVRQAYAIAVDASHSLLYWFDNDTRIIYRSTLTGTAITPLIGPSDVNEARALALDLEGGKIYWSEKGLRKIKRANLDGTAPEVVVDLTLESNKPPWGVVVVPASL